MPRVQIVLGADEPNFLPLPAAAECRWHPEFLFRHFQQVEE